MEKKGCDECLKYFNSGGAGGFNCAESTMYGITKALGLESEAYIKFATPFGGGMGRNGYLCGCLAVGMMMLGNKFGRTDVNEPRDPAYQAADNLLKKFLSKFGKLNCKDLTGLDLKNIDNTGAEKQHVHETVCRPIVVHVCEWVKESYEKHGNVSV